MSAVGLEIIVQPEVEWLGDGPFARSVEHLTAPLCRCGRVTYEIDWPDKGPVHGMQEKWGALSEAAAYELRVRRCPPAFL